MADAQVLYDEDVAATVATDTNWVTTAIIPAASFTANKRYLILASCAAELASATGETRMRLVHGATPTVFPDGSLAHETLAALSTSAHQMSWMYDFTQPGTTEDVAIQLSSSSTSDATNRLSQIIAIKLDDDFVSGTDYHWAEDTTDYTMTATPTAKAATSAFVPNGTDRWLFIGNMIYDGVSVVDEVGFELHDSVAGVLGMCQREVEDATLDFLGHNIYWVGVPSNASRVISVRPFNEAGSNVMLSSRVFAINLSKFAQSESAFTAAEVDPATSPTFTNLQTVSITPDATGDFVFIAFACFDVGSTSDDMETRVQVNDGGGLANDPNYTQTNTPGIDSVDALDESGFSVFKLRTLTTGASRTINFDATQVAGTAGRWEDRGLVVFSKALAASGFSGSGGVSVPHATLDGTGKQEFVGSGGVAVPHATLDGTGSIPLDITGDGAVAVPHATIDATGKLEFIGSAEVAVPHITVDGSGSQTFAGTGAVAVPHATIDATGKLEFLGSGDVSIPHATVEGTGTVADGVTGTGAVTVPPAALTGSGTLAFVGSGGVVVAVAQVDGTGDVPAGSVVGTGDVLADPASITGAGTVYTQQQLRLAKKRITEHFWGRRVFS